MLRKVIFLLLIAYNLNTVFAQNLWSKKADFVDSRYKAVSFSINNVGFVGCGHSDTSRKKDFYAYYPTTNTWVKIADFIGEERMGAFAFTIGNKGYVGGGYNPKKNNKDTILTNAFSDFYAYNVDSNSWTKKANLPFGKKVHAVTFSVGNKGYVALGNDTTGYVNDFWEYDPITDKWQKKTSYPDSAAVYAVGFSIGNYGYVGTGLGQQKISKYFWRYNPVSDSWSSIASIDSAIFQASAFSLNGKGYVIGGLDINNKYYTKLLEYDPVLNKWINKAIFPAGSRIFGSAFSVDNAGYFGLGLDSNYFGKNDWWEYKPSLVGIGELTNHYSLNLFPNPNDGNFSLSSNFNITSYQIFDAKGMLIIENNFENETIKLALPQGIYLLKANSQLGNVFKQFVVN